MAATPMTPRTPTTAALHEEHTCRDCGAVITLPYARPPKHIGWAVPDPAPLDVERLARALAATDDAEWRLAIEDDYDPLNGHVEWWDTPRNLAEAIAREYAKDPQP